MNWAISRGSPLYQRPERSYRPGNLMDSLLSRALLRKARQQAAAQECESKSSSISGTSTPILSSDIATDLITTNTANRCFRYRSTLPLLTVQIVLARRPGLDCSRNPETTSLRLSRRENQRDGVARRLTSSVLIIGDSEVLHLRVQLNLSEFWRLQHFTKPLSYISLPSSVVEDHHSIPESDGAKSSRNGPRNHRSGYQSVIAKTMSEKAPVKSFSRACRKSAAVRWESFPKAPQPHAPRTSTAWS